jgi:hypothetical protein
VAGRQRTRQPGPTLESLLANVRRGQVAYLVLTPEQKRALRNPGGRVALDVLRHLLGARPATPERFPLTEQVFQAVARKLGYLVGQKRCRTMIRRLRETRVVAGAGHYGSRTGTRPSGRASVWPSTGWGAVSARLPPAAFPSDSVLSATRFPSSGNSVLAGGSTPCSVTSWGCRRPVYPTARRGRCGHVTRFSRARSELAVEAVHFDRGGANGAMSLGADPESLNSGPSTKEKK